MPDVVKENIVFFLIFALIAHTPMYVLDGNGKFMITSGYNRKSLKVLIHEGIAEN